MTIIKFWYEYSCNDSDQALAFMSQIESMAEGGEHSEGGPATVTLEPLVRVSVCEDYTYKGPDRDGE